MLDVMLSILKIPVEDVIYKFLDSVVVLIDVALLGFEREEPLVIHSDGVNV